jgi:hypothetical protein
MCKRSIAALIWVLIAAIPLQGIAAAAMIHCGTHHDSTSEPTQAGHQRHDHASASHHTMSDTDGTASAVDHDGDAKCSACAACCLGLALPTRFSALLPVLPSLAARCGMFSSAPDVVITGPERPPRILLV